MQVFSLLGFSVSFTWFDHKNLLEFFGILVSLLGFLRLVVPEAWSQFSGAVEAYYVFKRRLRELRAQTPS